MGNSDRLSNASVAASYFQDYGTASTTNQVMATFLARHGDSQLALGAPTLLTDQYMSQRGVNGVPASAVTRSVLSVPDHNSDFG